MGVPLHLAAEAPSPASVLGLTAIEVSTSFASAQGTRVWSCLSCSGIHFQPYSLVVVPGTMQVSNMASGIKNHFLIINPHLEI
jgi:hypothetical protein